VYRTLYELALCSGLRENELHSLRVCNLDGESGGLILDAAWTKNRKPGFQALSADLVARLKGGTAGKAPDAPLLWVPANSETMLDKYLKLAGIPKEIPGVGKLDFHALRTTYTTLVIESGAPVKEAQTLLRHGTPGLTMNVYARTRDDQLKRVAERVGMLIAGSGSAPKPPQSENEGENDTVGSGSTAGSHDEKDMAERPGFEPGEEVLAPSTA